jgi:hypothetical protein
VPDNSATSAALGGRSFEVIVRSYGVLISERFGSHGHGGISLAPVSSSTTSNSAGQPLYDAHQSSPYDQCHHSFSKPTKPAGRQCRGHKATKAAYDVVFGLKSVIVRNGEEAVVVTAGAKGRPLATRPSGGP